MGSRLATWLGAASDSVQNILVVQTVEGMLNTGYRTVSHRIVSVRWSLTCFVWLVIGVGWLVLIENYD
jgi:hypothetical protein